jgi:predicted nucleic-acid-binding protein
MKALDTNVLIRFLIEDDPQQAAIVHQLFRDAEQSGQAMRVTSLVLLESIWVLESVYQVSRSAILDTISELLALPVLEIEQQPAIRRFIESARTSSVDLSDALIGHCARGSGCEVVLTFDKEAARSELFERLKKVPNPNKSGTPDNQPL